MNTRFHAPTAMLLVAAAPALHAQGVATDRLIDAVTVTAARERATVQTPQTSVTRTAAQLREQNLVNPEDALRYAPNLTIRKRYIGDRNALIGGRSFSTLQAPRALVFMDGYLLSNFLGRFDAPRWNMVAPEEIERVDVLYGPFSAIHPGNSMGTTVVVTTRRPAAFEVGARTTAFTQRYEEYGLTGDYDGYQASGYLGGRLGERAWWSLAANRQDALSHPMQYYTVSAGANGEFPAPRGAAPATTVSGVVFDVDPQGRRRAVFGASNGALDRAQQDQLKLRGGYQFREWLELEGFAAQWRNDSAMENRTLMRDASGAEVWSGRVLADGVVFDVPASALAPSARTERHAQWGATLRTRRSDGWNGSLVYSQYAIREDLTRQALSPDPSARHGGPGTLTEREGTGWRTFEAQAVRDIADHALAFGVHRNDYELRNPVYAAGDWRGQRGALSQNVYGDTRLIAWYAQDAWRIAERWSLTLGARYEQWRALDGGQVAGAARIDYAERSLSALSPKASIAFDPGAAWTARLSVGRGVRFPTVAELFQGTATASSITVNDPDLEAEVADAVDFTVERSFAAGRVRASVFQDDVRDSIFAQTNIAVTPNVTNVQNIERVRSRGAELDFAAAPTPAWSFTGNLAYVHTRILENANNPTYVGNEWPRVPHWRGSLQASWRPASAWLASLAARYSGRMYNRLENDDVNPDVYGGVSRFTMLDARVAYTASQGVEVALGVDNLTDERAYQSHPYPGRTAYLEARWSLGDEP